MGRWVGRTVGWEGGVGGGEGVGWGGVARNVGMWRWAIIHGQLTRANLRAIFANWGNHRGEFSFSPKRGTRLIVCRNGRTRLDLRPCSV